ncbi:MAG: hypothetical protein QG622_1750 [Actinomycetota bacterium]|nr:hypothetical protein [Actinomycetota bacterium]
MAEGSGSVRNEPLLVDRPTGTVWHTIRTACRRLYSVEDDFVGSFRSSLVQLVPELQHSTADGGLSIGEGLARAVLWAALTDDPPETVEATFSNLGAEYGHRGFPEDGYHGAGHALLRAARDNQISDWTSELSSGWVAFYGWLAAHLVEGAKYARLADTVRTVPTSRLELPRHVERPVERSGSAASPRSPAGPRSAAEPRSAASPGFAELTGRPDPPRDGPPRHVELPHRGGPDASTAPGTGPIDLDPPFATGPFSPGSPVREGERAARGGPPAGSGAIVLRPVPVTRTASPPSGIRTAGILEPAPFPPSAPIPVPQPSPVRPPTPPSGTPTSRPPGTLDEVLDFLRARYFGDDDRALTAVLTRVALRTGADLRAPRPDQRANPAVIANVLAVLQVMGYVVQTTAGPDSLPVIVPAAAQPSHPSRWWNRRRSGRGWRRSPAPDAYQ